MERKLATIRQIKSLHEIPGADNIVLALIDGWQAVVKKNEFKEGDTIVFCEIDSFMPNKPEYSFLGTPKLHQGKLGHRIKTIRLRKTLSQGLVLPLPNTYAPFKPGDDVTDYFEITKYDNSLNNNEKRPGLKMGDQYGSFPSFIPKSDQERLQNLGHFFDIYKDHYWEETLKLDGSSMTCYNIYRKPTILERIKAFIGLNVKPTHFGVCSRNIEIKRGANSNFWTAAINSKIEEHLPVGYALQGELIGPNIQSNHEKVEQLEYHIYDIYNIDEQRYLTPDERVFLFSTHFSDCLNLYHVPIVGQVKIFNICPTIEDLLKRVEGKSINPKTISEGRVYKSIGGAYSFKCINNQYLLKCEE